MKRIGHARSFARPTGGKKYGFGAPFGLIGSEPEKPMPRSAIKSSAFARSHSLVEEVPPKTWRDKPCNKRLAAERAVSKRIFAQKRADAMGGRS